MKLPGWGPHQAGEVKLQAGMPAGVFIKGEARTPLQYLAEPVTQVLQRAGRERQGFVSKLKFPHEPQICTQIHCPKRENCCWN